MIYEEQYLLLANKY